MNSDVALYWLQEALQLTFLVAAPLLGTALAVGLVISLFQAVTSIQEQTLSSIPKMLAVAAVLLVMAPWMLEHLTDFAAHVFAAIPEASR